MIRKAWCLVLLPLALTACSDSAASEKNLSALDAELVGGADAGNSVDPALMSALEDQIMVDPALASQANGDSIRPPPQSYSAAVPAGGATEGGEAPGGEKLMRAPQPAAVTQCTTCPSSSQATTLGGLAARQKGATKGCAANVRYSAAWAQRLPAELPLHPRANVIEAAGADGDCALRVVNFTVAAPVQHVLDWYYTRAMRGGYTAEHQLSDAEHILGGTRKRDDSAYVLFITAREGGGTEVDMVVNRGG